MSNLSEFLQQKNITQFEGYSQQVKEQANFLRNIVNAKSIKSVMEIGLTQGIPPNYFYLQIKI